MTGRMRVFLATAGCMFLLVLGLAPAHAANVLFTVQQKSGGGTFDVTDDILARLKPHHFKAVLPGGTGAEQDVGGPLLRDVIEAAGLHGTKVWAKALDGYEMDIPFTDLDRFDVIAATEVDGKPLTVRDRGPAWVVYPTVDHPELRDALYEARSVWQIKQLIVE